MYTLNDVLLLGAIEMKKGKLFFLLVMLLAIISIVACNKKTNDEKVGQTSLINDEEKLFVEIGQEIFEITDKEKIDPIIEILQNADWENAEVSMDGPYDFILNNKYAFWITPQKDALEVIMQGHSKFTKLAVKDSQILYETITDEKLGK